MKTGSPISDIARRIDHATRSARDFLANPSQMSIQAAEDGPTLVLDDGTGSQRFGIDPIAHQQLADHLDIPLPYYRRMLSDEPELLARSANTWLSRAQGRRLVRTVRSQEGRTMARALLSDRYRPLDHAGLLEALVPLLEARQVRIESCELTDRKLYLKAVSPRITGEVRVGETVMAGLVVANSEVGFGSVSIQPLIYTLRCTNGMIIEDASLRQNHLGRRLGDPANTDIQHLISDEARQADDRGFFLMVRDVAAAALDPAVFQRHLLRIQEAAGRPITSNRLDQVVEVTARRFNLGTEEREGVLAHLIRGGDLSQWGLSSAITRFSQDTADYERATDLERIGGRIIDMPQHDWLGLASVN